MKIQRMFLLLVVGLLSCSSDNSNECFTADSVNIIDRLTVEDHTYVLVFRIAGWHDKSEHFEVYHGEPSFDRCAAASNEPFFEEGVYYADVEASYTHYVSHIYLTPPDKITLSYTKGDRPSTSYYEHMKLELKPEEAGKTE